jgi:hypothetical protein
LSSPFALPVDTILQVATTNCTALQNLPNVVGIQEIKKPNIAVEWVPVMLLIWDVRSLS